MYSILTTRRLREARNSEEIRAGFVLDGAKKCLEDSDTGLGEATRAVEPNSGRQILEAAAKSGDGVCEEWETGIAAHFADGAQDADGAELFQDIGIAEDGGFDAARLVLRLMLADHIEDRRNFFLRETQMAQNGRRTGAGEGNVIPSAEFKGIIGAVANEDAEVVQPCGGANDIRVVIKAGADHPG